MWITSYWHQWFERRDDLLSGEFEPSSEDYIAIEDSSDGIVKAVVSGEIETTFGNAGDIVLTPNPEKFVGRFYENGILSVISRLKLPYVIGSYIGNGVSGRVISLGFTPAAVIVRPDFNTATNVSLVDFATIGYPGYYGSNNCSLEIVTGGLKFPSGAYANKNGQIYHYIAFI